MTPALDDGRPFTIRRWLRHLRRGLQEPVRFLRLSPEIRATLIDLALAQGSELRQRNWFRSRASMQSVGRDGKAIPWYVYPMIDFISERIRPDMRVLEFGAGHSTVWWAERVAYVKSFESNELWFKEICDRLSSNGELVLADICHAPRSALSRMVDEPRFDIVVVDGGDRNEILLMAPQLCNDDGVIILDNCERPEYARGIAAVQRAGFKELKFTGMGPVNLYAWSTSVFYRPANCLGI